MKILAIRFSSAGDVILTSLFVRALRKRFPAAELHYVVKKEFAPLVEHSPYLDQVHALQPGSGLAELREFKRELKQNCGRFDLVFDLHDSLRSKFLRAGLGRQLHIFHKPTYQKWLLVRRKVNRLQPIVPIPERYLATGNCTGLENDGEGLDLFIGKAISPIEPDKGRYTVGIAPGARHVTKRWPLENYAELVEAMVRNRGARIILFGAPDEQILCEGIVARVSGNVINLAGKTTLLESAAAADVCDIIITNDSAMAHVAAARKRPVVAIFGSTVQEFGFAPYGTQSVVAEVPGLYCRPCTTIGRDRCPEGHFKCMREVGVEEVYEISAGLNVSG